MHFRIGQWQMWNSARVCALWVWLSPLCLATLAGEPPPRPADVFKPIAMSELPDFKAELEEKVTKKGLVHTNGLVATINYKEFKEPKVEGAIKIKLPAASTGFKGEMEVCALWQPGKAPLAIPLLGIYEEHDDKLVRAWQAYLFEAGCHVVTFDSPFRNDFNSRSVHGVVGNLEEDAKVAARLIEALLDYRDAPGAPPLRENVTCLRLLGTSYGGFLALHMVRQERAKLGPIDRVLILSAPVKMSTALHTIDQFHEVDRARFQTSLIKLMGGYTPDKPDPSERELSLMRAGIGYDFYDTLDSILKHNEETYMPGLFDKFKAEEEALVQKEKFEARENELKTKQEQEALALERKYLGLVVFKEEY